MRIKQSHLRKIIREEIRSSCLLQEWVPDQDTPPPPTLGGHIPLPEPFDPEKAAEDLDIGPFVKESKRKLKILVERDWKGEVAPKADPFVNMIRKAWNNFSENKMGLEDMPDIKSKADWATALISAAFTGWEIQTLYTLGFTAAGAAKLNALATVALAPVTTAIPVASGIATARLLILYILAFAAGWIIGEAIDEGFEAWWRSDYWNVLEIIIDKFPTGTVNKLVQDGGFENSLRLTEEIHGPLYNRLLELIDITPSVQAFIKKKSSGWGARPLIHMILAQHVKLFIKILAGFGPGTGLGEIRPLIMKMRES